MGLSLATCCRKKSPDDVAAIAQEKAKMKEQMEADPIISSIGQVGWWQVLVAVPLMLANWTVSAHQLVMIFQKPDMNYTCATPDVDDPCSSMCKHIEYDRSIFKETIISEWDLICEKKTLANATQTIAMFGVLLGNIIFGYLGDRFGRKIPLVISSMMTLGFGVAAAVVPWFWLFCVMRFCVNFAIGGVMVMSLVIIMEIIGPSWREVFSIIFQFPFNLGFLSLPLLAYLMRNWRDVQLTISLVSLFKISYIFITPESPMWLILHEKQEQASKVLQKAARINKRPITGIDDKIIAITKRKSNDVVAKKGTLTDIIRYPYMRLKAFCMIMVFFSCGITFFGVADYVGTISGDIFANVAISAAICIPGTFISIILCKYLGRKTSLFIAFCISAISLILIACISERVENSALVFSIIGIFGVSLAFPTAYLYAGELFPTSVRNSAIGFCNCASVGASMIAPFIVQLRDTYYYLPPLIIGVFPIVAAILCLLLPETMGKVLPDTIEESEQFGRRVKHKL